MTEQSAEAQARKIMQEYAQGDPCPSRHGARVTDAPQLLQRFLRLCAAATIPSKEGGAVRCRLWDSQLYVITEIFAGLQAGFHDFVVQKFRQGGISTVLWLLDLFWLLQFPAMQGIYIADDEPNKEVHRDLIGQIYLSLPPRFSRGRFRAHNRLQTTWYDQPGWVASRLQWAFANKQNEGQLGRSRGINVVHGTEMDSWTDRAGVAALAASLAHEHPRRLYIWEGTGQGYGLLYEMAEQAQTGKTSKWIFVGFWRQAARCLHREDVALWNTYARERPSPEEREWIDAVKRRYDFTISQGVLGWWRYYLHEGKGINGDEQKMLQEYPWLPEHSFQAVGSQFLSGSTCLRLRTNLDRTQPARHYRYEWGGTFDERGDEALTEVSAESASLHIWDEPDATGVYIVAADPAYGSSPEADRFAATVWRAYPDRIIQVAEYCSPVGAMYQFAWVVAHLAGNYGRFVILELNGPGIAVLQELDRMANYAFGLRHRAGALQYVVGSIQHYLWRRADSLSGSFQREWRMGPQNRLPLMEKLRDTVERGALVVRSRALLEELGALRRVDGDRIAAGGVAHDDLAITAALAVECWTETVIPEIEDAIAPHEPPVGGPRDATELTVATFLSRIQQPADEPARKVWGVRHERPR